VTENELQRQILDALAAIKGVVVWRSNTGVSRSGGRFVRFGVKGQGDITGLLPGGRRLEIEVKTATGKVSEEQLEFGVRINSHGGLWFVARSVEEALNKILEVTR
jgi:hypothetical protein